MQFTDIAFAVFMAIFFCVYWLALRKKHRLQNIWLLVASYTFYGWWDWRFLILIVITSSSSFYTALLFDRYRKKWPVIFNIILNLGILAAFKYFNFFTENIARLFSLFGINLDWVTIDILLPVGISFYTFQAIGYSIDVMRGTVRPTHDLISFFTFIAFFPQLVAGPIESARTLLPQILRQRQWNPSHAASGLRLTLYGVMKKVCVADMLAIYADRIFAVADISAHMALFGGIIFSLQLYCDFSAYSEIARGTARMLGIELMVNFRFPYFSRNIFEFWKRWHISLMLWFRDYLYIPLGGNRRGKARTMLNYAIVFLLSGLWHGAAWNFVIWGCYWAACYIIGRTILHLKLPQSNISLRDIPSIIPTFMVVTFGFSLFRSSGMTQTMACLGSVWIYAIIAVAGAILARLTVTVLAGYCHKYGVIMLPVALAVATLVIIGKWEYILKFWWLLPALTVAYIEWKDRNGDSPLCNMPASRTRRYTLYWAMGMMILLSEPTDMAFIYFQF